MNHWRLIAAVAAGLIVVSSFGCRAFGSGPTDQEVVVAVKKSPPSPPTAGATYLAKIASVEIQERGRYNTEGKYWPVRVRLQGGIKIKVTNLVQLGLMGNPENQMPKDVDFIEEARFARDDFGNWRVAYIYDPRGPKWRIDDAGTAELGR